MVVALLVNWFLSVFIKKAVKKIVGKRIQEKSKKRVETLISIFGGTSKFMIGIVALLMILPEFGVNIGALLAGMGVAGLAVGMAAREIISDFIAGVFILLENLYSVGDKVQITGIEGTVEEITLRRTIIKDGEGVLHSIPNSQIKTVARKPK